MAIREMGVAAARQLSKQEAVAQAVAILNALYDGVLSSEEMVRRVSAVRDLLNFEMEFDERDELDRILLRWAFRERNATLEVCSIIRNIFKALAPKSGRGQ